MFLKDIKTWCKEAEKSDWKDKKFPSKVRIIKS
jgi:hypothetical protein